MGYSFKGGGERTPWSWRQMFAGMSANAKDLVLGSSPRLGVVHISCEPIAGSYDHKRWHAAKQVGGPFDTDAPVPVWDFVIVRTDGSTVRFHTNYSNNKVEVATAKDPPVLPGPPRRGKGNSDGPGTYRSKTSGNYTTDSRKVDKTRGGGEVAGGGQVAGGGSSPSGGPGGGQDPDCWVLI